MSKAEDKSELPGRSVLQLNHRRNCDSPAAKCTLGLRLCPKGKKNLGPCSFVHPGSLAVTYIII